MPRKAPRDRVGWRAPRILLGVGPPACPPSPPTSVKALSCCRDLHVLAVESQLLLIPWPTSKKDPQNPGGGKALLSIPSPSYGKGGCFSLFFGCHPFPEKASFLTVPESVENDHAYVALHDHHLSAPWRSGAPRAQSLRARCRGHRGGGQGERPSWVGCPGLFMVLSQLAKHPGC